MERDHRPLGLWPAEAIPASRADAPHVRYWAGPVDFRRSLGGEVCEFQVTLNGRHF
jgi:hypothetical protein